MNDGSASQWHGEQVLASLFGALLNRQWHLFGLAVAQTNTTVAVADNDERSKGEPASTLYDLGHTVDVDDAGLTQLHVRIVFVQCHQNSSPAARAASASAATRPW